MGDIHGEYKHLVNVLKKSKFDYNNDLLIQLGDLVDRGPEPFKCILELLKIKNTIFIRGNHDKCFEIWRTTKEHPLGRHPFNGTQVTLDAWEKLNIYDKHFIIGNFLNRQVIYHITDDNIMFVHGGFPIDIPLEEVDDHTFMWDRDLVKLTTVGDQFPKGYIVPTPNNFKKIYLGHTPTIYWDMTTPMSGCGVYNIDTGCGKGGPLTIMNIDTGEYWQAGPKIQEDEEEKQTQEITEASLHPTVSRGEKETERTPDIG
jgi:serine/threonine protein phosphatase 1